MPRSTASGLRITPTVAPFYNYQIHPSSVEADVRVYAKGAARRGDFTGFQSRKQRAEDAREAGQDGPAACHSSAKIAYR
jgi:hypothetical protein